MTEQPAEPPDDDSPPPRLFAAWMNALQAELMLRHLAEAGASWPQANLYCHSCVTALRSVTLILEKEMKQDAGFEEWYGGVQDVLAQDAEFRFLRDARNYVLHEGALQLMLSYSIEYSGPLHYEVRGIGPSGPDLWVSAQDGDELVPADWRKIEGFRFDIPLRLAVVDNLPEPPERELRGLLREKILKLRLILHEAEARFDPASADAQQAAAEEAELGHPWREDAHTA